MTGVLADGKLFGLDSLNNKKIEGDEEYDSVTFLIIDEACMISDKILEDTKRNLGLK